MKVCIWCSKSEDIVNFNKIAHTIPQSLGGNHICKNVCDSCNEYFGNKEFGKPAIEITLKEVFSSTAAGASPPLTTTAAAAGSIP